MRRFLRASDKVLGIHNEDLQTRYANLKGKVEKSVIANLTKDDMDQFKKDGDALVAAKVCVQGMLERLSEGGEISETNKKQLDVVDDLSIDCLKIAIAWGLHKLVSPAHILDATLGATLRKGTRRIVEQYKTQEELLQYVSEDDWAKVETVMGFEEDSQNGPTAAAGSESARPKKRARRSVAGT